MKASYSAQYYPVFTREHVPNFRPDVFTHSGSGPAYCSALIERQLTGRNWGIAEFLAFSSVVLDGNQTGRSDLKIDLSDPAKSSLSRSKLRNDYKPDSERHFHLIATKSPACHQSANACAIEKISSLNSCIRFRTVSLSIFMRNNEGI